MTKVLDCEFIISSNRVLDSGSVTDFGDGIGDISVSGQNGYNVNLYVSIVGDSSLIDRIEWDMSVIPNLENYGYYDSNSSWISLVSTNTVSYTSGTSQQYHCVFSYNSYPSQINSILCGTSSSSVAFSNLRIYDSNGNVLNMDIVTPSFSTKIGTLSISKCYLGTTAINKIYLGSNLLFEYNIVEPIVEPDPYSLNLASGATIQSGSLSSLNNTSNTNSVVINEGTANILSVQGGYINAYAAYFDITFTEPANITSLVISGYSDSLPITVYFEGTSLNYPYKTTQPQYVNAVLDPSGINILDRTQNSYWYSGNNRLPISFRNVDRIIVTRESNISPSFNWIEINNGNI